MSSVSVNPVAAPGSAKKSVATLRKDEAKGERRAVKIEGKSLTGVMSAFIPGARTAHSTSVRNIVSKVAPTAAAHSTAAASASGALSGSTGGEDRDRPMPLSPAVAAGAVMPAGGCFHALAEEGESDRGVLS